MRKRIAYSQNFLRDKGLVAELIEKSTITDNDVVFEIGAGQGIITEMLLKKSKKIVAFEIDGNLFSKLKLRFQNNPSLELRSGDFLTHTLPTDPYKVFSNIPFNITAAVIKKLTEAQNPPDDAYLIVQVEAAKKYIGKPYDNKNSQMAILLKPWFDTDISHKFRRDDFFPIPKVDTILLRLKKREDPYLKQLDKTKYQDFVVYTYNQFKPNVVAGLSEVIGKQTMLRLAKTIGFTTNSKPSQLDFNQWLNLFHAFMEKSQYQEVVRGSYDKLILQQNKLEKVHRTRIAKDWKRLKKDNL